jgi:hypothetical protein
MDADLHSLSTIVQYIIKRLLRLALPLVGDLMSLALAMEI